ncbi:hypothetical protein P8452_66452 [Trifolium repens]|nr:hypothetical protein P8452_66452 [Trifolium repens]
MRFSNPHSFSSSQHINRLFSIDSQPSLIPLPVISFDSQPSFSNPPLFVLQHPFFCPSNQILFVSGVSLTIGLKSTMQFFVKRSNFKADKHLGFEVCYVHNFTDVDDKGLFV